MIRPIQCLSVTGVAILIGATVASAQIYEPPTGGWTYIYSGGEASPGDGFTALDGTWSHDNGSDSWDESVIGEGSPGGVTGGLVDGDTVFMRMQDTGDPRDFGFSDPGSNRKVYFGHDITAEGASDTILDDGVTLSFRARIATGDPLDDLHEGGVEAPWPEGGLGYALHNGAKSNFTILQNAGGAVSFALANENNNAPGSVLRMNNLNGTEITGDVDTGDAGTANELSIPDATQWNEFWITIEAGGAGTHQVQVFANGSGVPSIFDVTAGNGRDFSDISYIAMGLGATPLAGAIDVDFFAWRDGVFLPGTTVALGDFNEDGVVDELDFFILSDNLAAHLDGPVGFSEGDINFDGRVDLEDFSMFKELFPGAVAQAQAAGVPEPTTTALLASALVVLSLAFLRNQGSRLAR